MYRYVPIFLLLLAGSATAQTTCTANECTIRVNWALDVEPDSSTHTCSYTQGGLFQPDTTGEGAGKCTFRRAIREAGARSDTEGSCQGADCGKPIIINFDNLDGTNNDADDIAYNTQDDYWVLPIDAGSSANDHFQLRGQTVLDTTGDITIMGGVSNMRGGHFGFEIPNVFIDSTASLAVQLSNVAVLNMGFFGGFGVSFGEPGGRYENNMWGLEPDGQTIHFAFTTGQSVSLAGGFAVNSSQGANDLKVRNNVIAGAFGRAISIGSMSTGVEITNNWIGTRADGTVPPIPANFECRTFTTLNPTVDPQQEWFGGWGIQVSGTGALVQDNVIAGLQNIRSTNDTPPMAIEAFGALHVISNNVIGQDVMGNRRGVCGQGIKFSTNTDPIDPQSFGHVVINNLIDMARNGFENTKGAILWSDTTNASERDGGNTVRGNIVIDGPERYLEFGPQIATSTKQFEPAEITMINGLNVTGRADTSDTFGGPSPCANCLIDLYLDDFDDVEEAIEHLGSAVADANGDFVFTLQQALPNGFGIRTTSTNAADDQIGQTWAGTTSEMSNTVYFNNDLIFINGFE